MESLSQLQSPEILFVVHLSHAHTLILNDIFSLARSPLDSAKISELIYSKLTKSLINETLLSAFAVYLGEEIAVLHKHENTNYVSQRPSLEALCIREVISNKFNRKKT